MLIRAARLEDAEAAALLFGQLGYLSTVDEVRGLLPAAGLQRGAQALRQVYLAHVLAMRGRRSQICGPVIPVL